MKKAMYILIIATMLLAGGCLSGFDQAVKHNQKENVERYLNEGKDINKLNAYGRTPLMAATFYGHLDLVELMIEKGADLDIQSKDGHQNLKNATALHYSVYFGWSEIADRLTRNGADPDGVTGKGQTPLHMAAYFGFDDSVKTLIEARANTKLKDNKDKTAMDYAVEFNFHKIANMLRSAQ